MKFTEKDKEKIQVEGWEHPHGYVIYLKDGWQNGNGFHSIAEDNQKAAYKALKSAIPCECDECKFQAGLKALTAGL